MSDLIVAFTGHRPNKLGGYDERKNLRTNFLRFIDNYFKSRNEFPKVIISGMALGVDTWAAQYAEAKGIELHAYVPFKGQELAWPKESQAEYNRLLLVAKNIIVVEPGEYAAWKLQSRNEAMVNNCSLLIGIWNGSRGGTANCLSYAKQKGIKTIIFDPDEIWRFKLST